MNPLALDLVAEGFATWNIEYRSVGHDGGGYPGTLHDVAAAIDHLPRLETSHRLDLGTVSVVGHSAGGQLALWSGSRHRLGAGLPGAEPVVIPTQVVGQAPVADLTRAAIDGLGRGAVVDFLGGTPQEVPGRYLAAQPQTAARVETVVVVGTADAIVPPDYSTVGPESSVELVVVEDADHFDLIDRSHRAWDAVVERLVRHRDRPGR